MSSHSLHIALAILIPLAAVLAVVAVSVVLSMRSFNKSFAAAWDTTDLKIDPNDYPPIATSFQQTGSLEMSTRVKGIFSRYQSRKYLLLGRDFYKMFEDGPHKWDARNRFAGKSLLTGHYFGASITATQVESDFYNLNASSSVLLEIDLDIDSILDLTYEENIDRCLSWIYENPELIETNYFSKLIQLIHHQEGGDSATDILGVAAHSLGYKGILFYSARALRKFETNWTMNPEDPLIFMTERVCFPDMRERKDLQVLVVFHGSDVISGVERYRVHGKKWIPNTWHNATEEALDEVLEFPSSTQNRRRLWVGKKITLGRADKDHPGDSIIF